MVPQERCLFFKNKKKKKKLSPACCHYVIGLILFSLCITTASPPDFIQWSSSFLIMEPRYSKYYVIFNFLLLIVHDGFKFQENYTSSMWKETGFTVIFKRCFVGGVICISEFWIFINCGLIEIVSSHQVSSFSFSALVFNRYSGKSWCSHLIPCAPQIKCSPTNRTTTVRLVLFVVCLNYMNLLFCKPHVSQQFIMLKKVGFDVIWKKWISALHYLILINLFVFKIWFLVPLACMKRVTTSCCSYATLNSILFIVNSSEFLYYDLLMF